MDKKILIIVLRAIGDVLLTTPLIRAIKKNMPGSRVYFLTGPASEKMLRHNPYLDGIIISGAGAAGRIKKEGFDITIDFMNSAVSGYYSLCSRAAQRMAFYRPWGFWCYNLMPKHSDWGYTVSDRLQMLDVLSIKYDGLDLDLKFTEKEQSRAELFLAENNISRSEKIITLDITNRREHRQWGKEKFCELADMIAGKFGAKIVFLWGPGEYEYVKNAVAGCRLKHILCDDLNVLELAPLIKKSRMHIGTSSAPAHIAVSQGTPSFVIYGLRTNPVNWTPPDNPHHGLLQGNLDVLTANEAFQKIEEFMKSNGWSSGSEKNII